MALVSSVFRDWWDDFERPHHYLDQHFGLRLTRTDLMHTLLLPSLRDYFKPWRQLLEQVDTLSNIEDNKDKFLVIIDMHQYASDEITVKTIDNFVIVEAKHEEKKDDHGFVSRKFVRRYLLPESHDICNVQSSLSLNGVLTITAPKLVILGTGEKIIPIKQIQASLKS